MGEIDTLTGGAGNDRFILGTATQVFYDDRNTNTPGTNDYGLITDFNRNGDVIQLNGQQSDYRLAASPNGLPSGTAIYRDKPADEPDELIGIVKNVSGLSLNDPYFQFTQNSPNSPSLSINDVTVNEADGTASFTVTRSGNLSQQSTVDFSTSDGSATAAQDYAATMGSLTFDSGEASQAITIPILNDIEDEANETFFVNLTNPTNATIADPQGTGTITDDDAPLPLSNFSIDDVTVNEADGTATFTVTRTGDSTQESTVSYATEDGTATAPQDYVAQPTGSVAFAAGETTQEIEVAIVDDAVDEDEENFFVNLTEATNGTIDDDRGEGTITDDDNDGPQRLTNNDYNDLDPQVSGNNVVWRGDEGNSDGEIFFYNGNTTTQLTNNNYFDFLPQISGSNVTWEGIVGNSDGEIFFYNGNTTTQLTNNNNGDSNPQISGSNVTWYSSVGPSNSDEIFFYSGSTGMTTRLTDNGLDDVFPQISGSNVTWYDNRLEGEIFFYNGSTTTQLTNNNYDDSFSQISGSNVVWDGNEGSSSAVIFDDEIFFYNGSTTTQLTNNSYDDIFPQISGSNVTWRGNPVTASSSGREIFFYNGNTTTQVTNNNYSDIDPQISGSNVVWRGNEGNSDFEIFLYNGSTGMTTQLTNNNYDDLFPQIDGNTVAWYGNAGLNGTTEIFQTTI